MKNKPTDSKAGPRMEEMLLIITDFAAVNLDVDTVIAWIPTFMDAVVDQLAAMTRLPATLWFGLQSLPTAIRKSFSSCHSSLRRPRVKPLSRP
jgi:hypothetical protein